MLLHPMVVYAKPVFGDKRFNVKTLRMAEGTKLNLLTD